MLQENLNRAVSKIKGSPANSLSGDTAIEIFARIGYGITNIDSQNVIGGDGSNLDGITYGGGIAYNFGSTDQFQFRLDYTEFNFGNDQDADSISIGLGYNF